MKQSNWQWQADGGGARIDGRRRCRWDVDGKRWHVPKMAGRKILNSSDRQVVAGSGGEA